MREKDEMREESKVERKEIKEEIRKLKEIDERGKSENWER